VRRFDPPLNRSTRIFVVAHFAIVLVAATTLLWFADTLPLVLLAAAALAILALLWLIGAVMQGRMGWLAALATEVAVGTLLAASLAAGLQVG
jgi:hypothetical protein